MKSSIIFDKVSKASLYLLVALIPLWFLPFTQNMVAYQKQVLLALLAVLGTLSWLASVVYAGEAKVRKTWLHVPVFGLLAALGISTLFSLWRYGSFWGWPLHATDNFLSFFVFVLVYVLISQGVRGARHLFLLLAGFLVSAGLAVAFALLQLKGVFLLPFDFAQSKSFTTLGSANEVAIIAALLLPLALALATVHEKAWKGVLWGVTAMLFLALLLLDFSAAWIVLIAGLAVVAAFDAIHSQRKSGRISLPMALMLAALFFLIVADFSFPGAVVRPAEVSPTYAEELRVLGSAISENPFAALVGTGPGTFVFDYGKFRSAESNKTLFWNTRFASGKAEIADWMITKGTLGVFFLGLLIALALYAAWKKVMEKAGAMAQGSAAGLLALIVGFTASLFLYPASFLMWFVFWLSAGGIAALAGSRKTISFAEGRAALSFAASMGLTLAIIFGAGFVFVGGQKYYAELAYAGGARAGSEGNIEEAIARVEKAAKANASVDLYWRDLAQLYLNKANRIAVDQTLSSEIRQQQAGVAVNQAIQAVQRATKAASNNVANWNVQGFVYRSLIGVPGADTLALQAYEEAQKLEPVSPFPRTESGRVKILSAQAGDQARLDDAIADLQRAIVLKPDYAPAHYLLAVAYDQQGKQQEAIAKLEETKLVAPQDVGLAFQLGVIYYRRDELAKARDEFERAKAADTRYSNARYMLGLAYDRLGRKADALAEFTAVAALNPDNREVKEILANLTAGRSALDGIGEPPQPPIADIPEEIAPEEQ